MAQMLEREYCEPFAELATPVNLRTASSRASIQMILKYNALFHTSVDGL